MSKFNLKTETKKFFSPKNMTMLAVLSALSYIFYAFIKFPLPFMFPGFLDMQFSDLPIYLASFITGPLGGVIVVGMRFALKIATFGSSTGYAGELSDVLLGLAVCLPAGIIYRVKRTKKGALLAIIAGAVCSLIMSVIANIYIIIPLYVQLFFNGNWDILLNMVKGLYGGVTQANFFYYYIPLAVIPFNTIRIALCSVATYFVYKRLSADLKSLFNESQETGRKYKTSVYVLNVLLLLSAVCLFVFAVTYLGAFISDLVANKKGDFKLFAPFVSFTFQGLIHIFIYIFIKNYLNKTVGYVKSEKTVFDEKYRARLEEPAAVNETEANGTESAGGDLATKTEKVEEGFEPAESPDVAVKT